MRKRIFAMLVALIMAISLLPVSALAAEEEPVAGRPSVSTPESSAVQIKKSVSEVNNDGTYTLSMEAYVTGQVVTTNPEPLDIVLVLDVSGSMADDISIVKEENVTYSPVADREPIRFFIFNFDTNTNSYVCSDWEKGGEYWYSVDGETFYPVTKIERKEREVLVYDGLVSKFYDIYVHYEYTYTVDGEDKVYATQEYKSQGLNGILGNDADDEPVKDIYYKTVKTEIQTVSKMKALQDAVKEFISATAKKNQNVDAASQHRISIVKFAGKSTNDIGNDTYEEGWYRYNHSQIVKELTVVDEAGAQTLSDAVNALQAAGATSADYGMAHAKRALVDSDRKQVVIFFTDGEPNHGNGFSENVANATVNTAKELKKDGGATIYTIGVFAGANPEDIGSKANKFMHAVSSNYPEAEKYTDVDRTPNNNGYYKTATTQDDLTDIFGTIAENMIPDATAGSKSVLTDTVSGWFTAPNNSAGVTVEVYQASGNGEAPVWTEDETFDTTDIKVTVSGQKISVTGFDYSANAVVKKDGSWQGKKLVISFAIAPDAAAPWTAGTKEYPTNVAGENEANNAGLSYGSEKTALTESPTVLITAYSVKYDANGGSFAEGVQHEFILLYGADMPTIAKADEPTRNDCSFQGWGASENATETVTLPATVTGNVTYYAIWGQNPDKYSVTYTWTGLPESEKVYTGTGTDQAEVTLPRDEAKYADGAPYTIDSTYTSATVAYTTDNEGNVKDRYIFSGWDKNDGTINKESVIVSGTWSLDNWHDANTPEDKDSTTGGDGIPDKYQVLVKYESENSDKGTVTPGYEVITLRNDDGTYVETADVTASGSTATAKSGYQFEKWTREDTTVATTAKTDEITIENARGGATYTFTAHFKTPDPVPVYVYAQIKKTVDGNEVAITGTELADVAAEWKIALTENDNGEGWLTIGKIENVPALQGVEQTSDNVYDKYKGSIVTSSIDPYTANKDVDFSWITFNSLKGNQKGAIDYANDYSVMTWHLDGVINVYSVTYTDGVDGEEVFADKTTNYVRAGEETPAFGEAPTRDGYVFVGWDKEVAETVTENVTYIAQWEVDVWKDAEQTSDPEDKDSTTGGDGIPDKYQVLVKYESEDSNKGTVTPEYEVITLRNDNGTYAESGTVVASGSTATANKNYTFKKWTNDFGAAEIKNAKTGEIVIEAAKGGKTYTFTANFAKKSTPYNPPVAPKLNKADHYAYVVGYPDGTVQPQGAITRAEVATIFFRLLSDETRDLYWTKDNGYTDVKAGDWFNNAVSTLSNAGIINGYPDGTFRPNAPITRAEMAKVIAMFAELNKDSAGFKDIAGHWAEAYIKLAAGNGWIAGYPDGTFRPDQDITRAETMTMINRVLERVPSTEKHLLAYEVMLTFPDNQPGDWYYIAVQEATNSHTYERYATEKNGDEQWIKLIDNYDWTKLEF